MKSIHYYILMLFVGAFMLNGCEVDENGPMPDTFEEGGVAYMVMEAGSSGLINLNDPAAFNLKGTIDVLFQPEFDKLTLMVAHKGDYANAKVLVDNITSTPHQFTVSLNNLISAIPQLNSVADIQIGDYFTFYVNVTKGGKEYPVYKIVGDRAIRTIAPGLITALRNVENAAAITDLRIDVPCAFDPLLVVGNYRAVSSAWDVDGPVTITADPNDPFIVYVAGLAALDGLNENLGPLKMVIDPNSYNVAAVKTALASNAWGYSNFSYQGSGKLNTCNGTYSMSFSITVDQGTFANNQAFTFTKQ
jgi:hypothetical protein